MALLSRSASFEERLGEVADVASILDDSRREEQERLKCFLQRDRKDFLSPEIVSQLEALDCRLLSSFEAGVGFVRARVE